MTGHGANGDSFRICRQNAKNRYVQFTNETREVKVLPDVTNEEVFQKLRMKPAKTKWHPMGKATCTGQTDKK